MQVNRPDPKFEAAPKSRGRFRGALQLSLGFVAILWGLELLDAVLPWNLNQFGVRPRSVDGLWGLLTMPLLHGGFMHLLHNTLPTVLMGTGLLYFYPRTAWRVIAAGWIGAGAFVWLVGASNSVHIGASGLNFALLGYILLGGLLRFDTRTLALSMVTFFYYGGMLTGILPIERGVSWEAHLGGLIIGVVMAWRYRNFDVPPKKRYAWEDEDEDDALTEEALGRSPSDSRLH